MNTIKYILIQIEMILMVISIILGLGAAEVNSWTWAYFLLFFPFIWGWASNFNAQIHFCEVYHRACLIKNYK